MDDAGSRIVPRLRELYAGKRGRSNSDGEDDDDQTTYMEKRHAVASYESAVAPTQVHSNVTASTKLNLLQNLIAAGVIYTLVPGTPIYRMYRTRAVGDSTRTWTLVDQAVPTGVDPFGEVEFTSVSAKNKKQLHFVADISSEETLARIVAQRNNSMNLDVLSARNLLRDLLDAGFFVGSFNTSDGYGRVTFYQAVIIGNCIAVETVSHYTAQGALVITHNVQPRS